MLENMSKRDEMYQMNKMTQYGKNGHCITSRGMLQLDEISQVDKCRNLEEKFSVLFCFDDSNIVQNIIYEKVLQVTHDKTTYFALDRLERHITFQVRRGWMSCNV